MKPWLLVAALDGLTLSGQQPESQGECGPGRKNAHACHCPIMVSRRQAAHEENCDRDSRTRKERSECMAKMPEACDILEHPGYSVGPNDEDGNPTQKREDDSCFKYCRLDL